MTPELRKTGISVVGDLPWGTHFCHFYETKQDLLDILVPYFKAGLESKEFCVWVVSDSEPLAVEEAKAALAQAVPDLNRHIAAGNIEILNALDWYLEKNVFNLGRVASAWHAELNQALALGYEGMRVSGDTFWLREKDWKDFCAYERQLNDSITDRYMNVLCTYPLRKSGAAEILDVAQNHQFAIARRQGKWEVIESLELTQARAEIKRLNEALQKVEERTPRASAFLRYGVAVVSVSAALLLALWMESALQSAPHVSLFLCAVMLSAWFGGIRPGLLAIALSLLAFAYILSPNYLLTVETREIPRLLIFALSALFVGFLSAAQRSKAESLRRARDVLDETVQELQRTNQALRAENTERGRVEEELRERAADLTEAQRVARIGNWILDLRTNKVSWSEQLHRIFEIDERDFEGRYESFVSRIHPDDQPRVLRANAQTRIEGSPFDIEYRIITPNDEVRIIREIGYAAQDEAGNVIRLFGTAQDITDRKRAEERIRATSEQLRALSAKLQSAKEEEDIRIAREIHDEMGSTLTSLRWDLERFDKVISEAQEWSQVQELRPKIAEMMRLTDVTIGTMRRIASELRPSILDDLGLPEAIEWQAQQFQARTGIACVCDCSLDNIEFDPDQSTAVFRIFQEALTNILSHAGATAVEVVARSEDGEFVLVVSDNGKGITEEEKSSRLSLGILGMRERAHLIGGEVEISGTNGTGTVVTVRVPKLE